MNPFIARIADKFSIQSIRVCRLHRATICSDDAAIPRNLLDWSCVLLLPLFRMVPISSIYFRAESLTLMNSEDTCYFLYHLLCNASPF